MYMWNKFSFEKRNSNFIFTKCLLFCIDLSRITQHKKIYYRSKLNFPPKIQFILIMSLILLAKKRLESINVIITCSVLIQCCDSFILFPPPPPHFLKKFELTLFCFNSCMLKFQILNYINS